MVGLSTIGSISFGIAFVSGRKRVPNPAAGMTAFLIFCMINLLLVYFILEARKNQKEMILTFYIHRDETYAISRQKR